VFGAPQPRSRLYTTKSGYARALAAIGGLSGYAGSGGARLEQSLQARFPGHQAVAMPMARVGIYLTLKALIRPGQKVILSPYTISDVVNMVLCAGGVPLFADVEAGGSCNIDPQMVADLLRRESDIGAVLVTHFYGLMCDIDAIMALCAERGIPVVEDAAQAFGARANGRPAGSIGRAGVFSFGLLKNVTSFVGGAVITRDPSLADALRREVAALSVFPRQRLLKKLISGLGFDLATQKLLFSAAVYWLFRYAYLHDVKFFANKLDTDADPVVYRAFPQRYGYRLSGVQAALACAGMPRVERDTTARVAHARAYDTGLSDLQSIVRPPLREDGSHIYFYYPIQHEERDALARAMTRAGRDVQISHHRNCASLPCFAAYARDCPNAERAARNVIYLASYPAFGLDQVAANVAAIRHYLRG
jgi:dTDP-4-amino-4,6-dideoxygalactose transaminase